MERWWDSSVSSPFDEHRTCNGQGPVKTVQSRALAAAAGSPLRGAEGLPRARHGRFQPLPAAPRQGRAEPLSQAGGASGKAGLRKGKTLPGGEGKSARDSPGQGGPGRGREEPLQAPSTDSPAAVGGRSGSWFS